MSYSYAVEIEKQKIGIIGGGQLGYLLIKYGLSPIKDNYPDEGRYSVRVIDSNANCSCAAFADELIVGDLYDEEKLMEFADGLDVITYETEHISIDALKKIEAKQPQTVFVPSIKTLEIIQNKVLQKQFFEANNIPTVPFSVVSADCIVGCSNTDRSSTRRMMWKSVTGGYDGKGVQVVKTGSKVPNSGILEDYLDPSSTTEYSVNVVVQDGSAFCDDDGNPVEFTVESFLPTKMVVNHDLHMLDYCMCSCELSYTIRRKLQEVAEKTALAFKSPGLFAVELFLTNAGDIYVNEVAPRPHNSSHYTIDVLPVSSAYTALAYMLTGLHFSTHRYQGQVYSASKTEDMATWVSDEMYTHYIMKNILGPDYMKSNVSTKAPEYFARSSEGSNSKAPEYSILKMHDDENIRVISYHKSETRPNRKIGHLTYTCNDGSEFHIGFKTNLASFVPNLMNSILVVPKGGVAVVMGSTSDWPVMKEACDVLQSLGVFYAKTVVSAHRTPDRLRLFAENARAAGLKCIIAGAGGAAHLPGMLAAYTELPIIGVPIASETSLLKGVDALHSIVQMPPGVPVATVAINGAKNAGILAAQITGYLDEVRTYKDTQHDNVILQANNLK